MKTQKIKAGTCRAGTWDSNKAAWKTGREEMNLFPEMEHEMVQLYAREAKDYLYYFFPGLEKSNQEITNK